MTKICWVSLKMRRWVRTVVQWIKSFRKFLWYWEDIGARSNFIIQLTTHLIHTRSTSFYFINYMKTVPIQLIHLFSMYLVFLQSLLVSFSARTSRKALTFLPGLVAPVTAIFFHLPQIANTQSSKNISHTHQPSETTNFRINQPRASV